MAGKFPGKFPPAMRIAAVVQAALLGLMAIIVVSAAGLAIPGGSGFAGKLIWGVVAFAALSVVANSMTPSARERRLWLPVACVLLATSLTVAIESL